MKSLIGQAIAQSCSGCQESPPLLHPCQPIPAEWELLTGISSWQTHQVSWPWRWGGGGGAQDQGGKDSQPEDIQFNAQMSSGAARPWVVYHQQRWLIYRPCLWDAVPFWDRPRLTHLKLYQGLQWAQLLHGPIRHISFVSR